MRWKWTHSRSCQGDPAGCASWPVPQPASGHCCGHRCLRGASSAGCQSTAQLLGKATGERCLLLRGPADSWLPRELVGFLSSETPRSGKLTGIPTSGSSARHCPSVRSFPLTATCDSRTSGFSASIKVQRFLLCSILPCALALQTDALTAGTQHWRYFHSQVQISNPAPQHTAAAPRFATGPFRRSWRPKPAFLLPLGHTFQTCCRIHLVNRLSLIVF